MNNTEFGYFDKEGNYHKTFEINLQNVPSSDPLAFAYGLNRGQMYSKEAEQKKSLHVKVDHGAPHRELAQEYLRGFLLEIRVLDHIILSPEPNQYFSFADEGLI
jgi:hypothetical protein